MLTTVVQEILVSVERLRPMPTSVTRILKELDNGDVSASRLAEYVGLDQALAALILQMANSASLGYSRTCTNLKDAVMRIGLKRLKSLLLASSSISSMNRSLKGYRLGAGDLWNHSLMTAMGCEALARAINYPDPEQAYVAGLLHDLGKLLLDQYILTDYGKIQEYIQRYQIPLSEVEEKLIGIGHAQVGGLIGERWQFPAVLVEAIRCHHKPSAARIDPLLPAIVNMANAIVIEKYQANSGLFDNSLDETTYAILRIQDGNVEMIRKRVINHMEQ